MKCTDVRATLPLLIYGDLEPNEAATLRDHLVHCPACRREHEALAAVRRVLDTAPAPHVEVDLPQLYQTQAARQMRSLRRWRHVALIAGAVAAVLLLTLGLRLEVRREPGQIVVRWSDPPPHVGQAFQPDFSERRQAGKPDLREDLLVLRELIHALHEDIDDREQRFQDRLDLLQRHVQALQAQADQRWNSTEQDVAALYLLTRKGEKP
jgi:hypothetical protein